MIDQIIPIHALPESARVWADPSVGNGSVPNGLTVADYWWRVTEDDDAWGNNDNDQGNDAADDDDTRYGSFGYWQYTQHIVVYDDVDPELTVTGEDSFCSISNVDCSGDVEFAISATDACTDDTDDVTITVGLDVGNTGAVDADATANLVGGVFSARYPQGTHRLVITANDGCGNFTTTEKVFSVVDCKAPAPIVIDAISVELMPSEEDSTGAAAVVWASDFIASTIYDCNGQDNTDTDNNGNPAISVYSINRVGEIPDASQTSLYVNCTEAVQTLQIEIHAWDAVGNHDYATTFLLVQDNMGVCTPQGSGGVAGAIATESSASVEGVEVQLSGARSMMYMTDANGSFDFAGLQMGHDYTVTPQLDRHALNGVSTFDLVLISKHILGVDALDSPYKVIAADVNNSKSVSTLDLIHLRKLILNIDTEFSNNTSWRFVDASYNFNNPANPLAESFAEVKNINNLDGEEEVDFVAIKVGDVNGSANVAEVRSLAGTFHLNVAEQALKAGNEYTIDIDAADLNAVQGYQFTMNVVNAEIVDVVAGIASEENFGVFAKEGVITTSWNGEATAGTLFSVVVRATADVNVSEVLSVGSRYTAAEAYNTADEVMGVALNINGTEATAANALFQNNPNPFQGETVIGFNLIDASEATITLQDVTGRILKVVEGDFNAGYNQVRLTATDLPSTGVFYYTLEAGEFTATKKMIVVE
ncbi:MAG: T9SS type A sorting domain-containing protein [Saprospiraceae bacterium]|nr:T9SS type A sorting domain-containing protein [Saprospiraceae bacterium]